MAMRGDGKGIEELQQATGTKDKVAQRWIDVLLKRADDLHCASPWHSKADIVSEIQTWFDQQPGEKLNPLLDITGLDPSQDTPVELLHTILLGPMVGDQPTLVGNMAAVERYQWPHRSSPIRAGYIIQYKNNLIGKHFKTLMQVLIFHVHKICTPEQFTLVKAASDLGARLWVPEIDDMDYYLEQLKIAVANLLDTFDTVDPLRILVKIKLHLLAHLPDDIQRFGPAIWFVTEIYEAYNGVF
ncbi:FAD-binding-3 domain-containing protein [Mycena sanguinolenta]|uniref:FAD-binding-3 domain-containing protein n=1 Tax=Mycena sanguinolenta TaxID=230812 RepID=A0A8H6X345_9AGAR|nr:FAD-binding-3 domain-containing protein [Mycena sanguinolenta]